MLFSKDFELKLMSFCVRSMTTWCYHGRNSTPKMIYWQLWSRNISWCQWNAIFPFRENIVLTPIKDFIIKNCRWQGGRYEWKGQKCGKGGEQWRAKGRILTEIKFTSMASSQNETAASQKATKLKHYTGTAQSKLLSKRERLFKTAHWYFKALCHCHSKWMNN